MCVALQRLIHILTAASLSLHAVWTLFSTSTRLTHLTLSRRFIARILIPWPTKLLQTMQIVFRVPNSTVLHMIFFKFFFQDLVIMDLFILSFCRWTLYSVCHCKTLTSTLSNGTIYKWKFKVVEEERNQYLACATHYYYFFFLSQLPKTIPVSII